MIQFRGIKVGVLSSVIGVIGLINPSQAEIVVLKNGNRIEGYIVRQDENRLVLNTGSTEVTFRMADVEKVEPGIPMAVFRQRVTRTLQSAEAQAKAGDLAGAMRTIETVSVQLETEMASVKDVPPEMAELLGSLEKARRDYIPQSPEEQEAEKLYQEGLKDLDFVRLPEAFAKFALAVEKAPKRADIQLELAKVAQRRNDSATAIAAYGAAIRLSPEAYYQTSAAPLLLLLEEQGRRLLADRRAADALPVFEELLLLRGTAGGAVSMDEFLARQTTRAATAPEDVLMQVYEYADDNDLVDLALAAVRKASSINPNSPTIARVKKGEELIAGIRQAVADGDLEKAAELSRDPIAKEAEFAEKIRESTGEISDDIEAAGLLAQAKSAMEANDYEGAVVLAQRIVKDFASTPSSTEAATIIRTADLEIPVRKAIQKAQKEISEREYDDAEETLSKAAEDLDVAASRQASEFEKLRKRIPREREADRQWELAVVELERDRYDDALARLESLASSYGDTTSGKLAVEWLNDHRKRLQGEAKRTKLFDIGAAFAIADPALWRAADDTRPAEKWKVAPVITDFRNTAWEQFDRLADKDHERHRDRRSPLLYIGLPFLLAVMLIGHLLWKYARPGKGKYQEVDQLDEEAKEATQSVDHPEQGEHRTCRMCGHWNPMDALVCGVCESPMKLTSIEESRLKDRDQKANFDPWLRTAQGSTGNDFDKYFAKAKELADSSDVMAAIENCNKALDEDRLRKDGHLLLAELYERVGKNDEAAKCYREVLLIDPTEVIVRQKIESLLSLSEQPLQFKKVPMILTALAWWSLFWVVMAASPTAWIIRGLLCIAGALLTWRLWSGLQKDSKLMVTAVTTAHVERPHAIPMDILSWRGQDRQAHVLARTITEHTGVEVPELGSWRLKVSIGLSLIVLALLIVLGWVNSAPWGLLAWPAITGLLVYTLEIHPRAFSAYVLLRHVFEETTSPWMDPHRPFKPNRLPVQGEFLVKSYQDFPLHWAIKPHPYGHHRQGILNSLQQTLNRHWACHQFYGGLRVVRDVEMPVPAGLGIASFATTVILILALSSSVLLAMEKSKRESRYADSLKLGYQNLLDGEPLEARMLFLESMRHAPQRAMPWLYTAHAMMALEQTPQAERSFLAALKLAPGDSVIHNDYGNFLQRSGRLADATRQYDAALINDGENSDILSNLGSAHYKLKQYAQALEALDRAVAAEPNHGRAYTTRGLVLEAMGRWREARESFEKAVEVAPDLAYTEVARSRLAEGERKTGDRLRLVSNTSP